MGDEIEPEVAQEEEKEVITDLSNPEVGTKYRKAADIVNKTIQGLIGFCKAGTKVSTACAFGDTLITKQCEMVYKNKKIDKGIAFPTCLSINNIVCHYSPLANEGDVVFAEGDVVKVDLGVHIDGYISVAAYTFVIPTAEGAEPEIPEELKNCVVAAYTALEAACRAVQIGEKNSSVTSLISKVCEAFDVRAVEGVLMHQLKQFVIDGNNVVLQKEDVDQKADEFEFEMNNAYTIDVCLSTGTGKPKQNDMKTNVFKRAIEQYYQLKMKASRQLMNNINKQFATLPFALRNAVDADLTDRVAKMGIVECMKHDLLHPYPVLEEKEGDFVVHLKATVLLTKNSSTRINLNGAELSLDKIVEKYGVKKELSEDLQKALVRPIKKEKKKKTN